jgi:p-cumate 2,3-dioxygenase alpha subunit
MELKDLVLDDSERGIFRVHRSSMTSPDLFALERERVFNHCWLYVGHESEVEQPGDYRRRRVADKPVFFVRGQDNEVRVFLNTCPHRGALVCRQDAGNTEVFQCFYHAWTFNDRGELVGLPDEEGYAEGFDRAERGLLPPPRVESYRGFYFLSFDPDIEDLSDYLADAKEFLDLFVDQSDTGLGMRVIPGSNKFGVRANWKLLVENSIDGYHGGSTHRSFFTYLKDLLGQEASAVRGASLGRVVALGNGHSVMERPSEVGRALGKWNPIFGEESKGEIDGIYARLIERHGQERADHMTGTVRNLLIYPNLIINDSFSPTIRICWPVAPDFMEVTAWAIFPREETGTRLERLLRNFDMALSPAGLAIPDDVEVVEACQAGFEAPEQQWSDISRGMHRKARNRDELQMRAFWRQWHAQMQGLPKAGSWEDRLPPEVVSSLAATV